MTQETFYQAVKNINKFEARSSVLTWLIGIAKNIVYQDRRKNKLMEKITVEIENAKSAEREALDSIIEEELLQKIVGIGEPSCEVVRDLLPSYIDEITTESDSSVKMYGDGVSEESIMEEFPLKYYILYRIYNTHDAKDESILGKVLNKRIAEKTGVEVEKEYVLELSDDGYYVIYDFIDDYELIEKGRIEN